jgi:hypothetical protein
MQTISQSLAFTPPQITATFDVPNGTGRRFDVEAKDLSGATIYQGSVAADLNGKPVTINILMNPAFFLGTSLIGTAQDDFGSAIARDGAGNIFIAGITHGDFSNPLSTGPSITGNAFLSKFDQYGQPIWTRQFGTTNGTFAFAVAVDGSGNIVVAGGTGGNLGGEVNHGFTDGFVAKFDPLGNHLWTRLIGDIGDDVANAVAVDASGNVYVTGFISSTTVQTITFAPTGGSGGLDAFVAKFDPSGVQQWMRQYGTFGNDSGEAIAVDASGNVYVAGTTDGGIDNNANSGLSDIFLSKLDPQGNNRTTRQFGSSDSDQAAALALDANGMVYVAGTTYGSIDGAGNVDPTGTTSDIFVVKFDTATLTQQSTWMAGTPLPAVASAGTGTVPTGNDVAHCIAVDLSGDVFVAGSINGVFPGNTGAGGYDSFVIKFLPTGAVAWARQTGTPSDDDGNGVAVDGKGNVFVTGTAKGVFDGLQSSGFDAFLMMFDTNGVKRCGKTKTTGRVGGGGRGRGVFRFFADSPFRSVAHS